MPIKRTTQVAREHVDSATTSGAAARDSQKLAGYRGAKSLLSCNFAFNRDIEAPLTKNNVRSESYDPPALSNCFEVPDQALCLPEQTALAMHQSHKRYHDDAQRPNQPLQNVSNGESRDSYQSRNCAAAWTHITAQHGLAD